MAWWQTVITIYVVFVIGHIKKYYINWLLNINLINIIVWLLILMTTHDDVIKWKHFPRNWPFVRGIHRSPVNSPHKGQWRGALMFSLICVWINNWVSNREAGDSRRYRAHYDVSVMIVTVEALVYTMLWYNLWPNMNWAKISCRSQVGKKQLPKLSDKTSRYHITPLTGYVIRNSYNIWQLRIQVSFYQQ